MATDIPSSKTTPIKNNYYPNSTKKETKSDNNNPSDTKDSKTVTYMVGATLLSAVVALGILGHKNILKQLKSAKDGVADNIKNIEKNAEQDGKHPLDFEVMDDWRAMGSKLQTYCRKIESTLSQEEKSKYKNFEDIVKDKKPEDYEKYLKLRNTIENMRKAEQSQYKLYQIQEQQKYINENPRNFVHKSARDSAKVYEEHFDALEKAAVEREEAYIDKTYNSVNKSAKESADVYRKHFEEADAINDFKEGYKGILPTLKLGKNDKIIYKEGEVYIKKADGSIVEVSEKEIPYYRSDELRDLKEADELMELEEMDEPEFDEVVESLEDYVVDDICKPILSYFKKIKAGSNNKQKYVHVADYEPTATGFIKECYGKNPRTIEVDKKLGEFSIQKEGDRYKYYYSIKDHKLLDIREIKNGEPKKLSEYKPAKGGKKSGGEPEIELIVLANGKTAQLIKMPDGRLLTPFEFHFPGAAKAEKEAQEYLAKKAEIQRWFNEGYWTKNNSQQVSKNKEVEVYV